MASYKDALDLLVHYDTYQQRYPGGSMASFGLWLSQHLQSGGAAPAPVGSHAGECESTERKAGEALFAYDKVQQNDEQQIAILLGRLGRYGRHYVKRSYGSRLSISLEEFGILAGAMFLGNPTKSELITSNLQEVTTGTEMIRRLLRNGLLTETPDQTDRRSKRIGITDRGKAILFSASADMQRISTLICANLTSEQKSHLKQLLIYLDDFHMQHYLHRRDDSVEELIQNFIE
jgi:DNA-binding MarR family transcriptional regulator